MAWVFNDPAPLKPASPAAPVSVSCFPSCRLPSSPSSLPCLLLLGDFSAGSLADYLTLARPGRTSDPCAHLVMNESGGAVRFCVSKSLIGPRTRAAGGPRGWRRAPTARVSALRGRRRRHLIADCSPGVLSSCGLAPGSIARRAPLAPGLAATHDVPLLLEVLEDVLPSSRPHRQASRPCSTPRPSSPPTLSINDVSGPEGGPGTTKFMVFTVTLSGAERDGSNVNFATATATATTAATTTGDLR